MRQPHIGKAGRTWSAGIAAALLVVSCGGGGGGGSSSSSAAPPTSGGSTTPVTVSPIEQSQGALLQRPVFQCGTSADNVTADTAANSVTLFESGPVRPLALSADGQRLYVA
ncbi:MAG: hypothetical protein RLZZ36_2074, partial [Pseudomonadota bacterium]